MTTIAERKKIAKLVMTIPDEGVINKIKALLTAASKKAKEKYIEQYNKEIDEAVEEMDKGEFYTQEQVNTFFAKWQKEKLSGVRKHR